MPGGAPAGAPRWCAVLLLLLQGAPAHYTAALLDEAVFDERVRTTIRTQSGAVTRLETVGREARWQVRAASGDAGIRVEAWYDSLLVWREGPEGRLTPDTDGLVGGRYRGRVSPAGRVQLTARPFVPPDVAEVSDLADAFATFLPLLAAAPLAVGASAGDSLGWRIVRRPDSAGADGPLQRFRWQRAVVDSLDRVGGDSAGFVVHSTMQEEGYLVWHPRRGPLAWHRDVQTDVTVPAEGPVQRAVRSRVVERLQGWRRSARP